MTTVVLTGREVHKTLHSHSSIMMEYHALSFFSVYDENKKEVARICIKVKLHKFPADCGIGIIHSLASASYLPNEYLQSPGFPKDYFSNHMKCFYYMNGQVITQTKEIKDAVYEEIEKIVNAAASVLEHIKWVLSDRDNYPERFVSLYEYASNFGYSEGDKILNPNSGNTISIFEKNYEEPITDKNIDNLFIHPTSYNEYN